MYISELAIRNFRLLKDVRLQLEENATLIVGRNNSGKTSLSELFRRLLSERDAKFSLEDFSLGTHSGFWKAHAAYIENKDEAEVRELLPFIEARLTIKYDEAEPALGGLSNFVVDLNPATTTALVVAKFSLEEGKLPKLFDEIKFKEGASEEEKRTAICTAMKERVPQCYKVTIRAVDPNDESNQRPLEWTKLTALLKSDFVNAQRGLDDETHREKDVLGKIFFALFDTASAPAATPDEKAIAEKLTAAVSDIQESIDTSFNTELKNLAPALDSFGYPGLRDPVLLTETQLDVERLLSNNTKMRYAGANGVTLPEAFNGLGTRNLIFILLKLFSFFKSYQTRQGSPGLHLVFIEEPEAHLHPQMQEVFVRQLDKIAKLFADNYDNGRKWPVQFVVTTHSSHIANEAPFDSIRYFLSTLDAQKDQFLFTRIKDLRAGLSAKTPDDRSFLHKYMTLTRCDLLFADKAVLIEGSSERIMMPKIVEKVDAGRQRKLANQYVTVMEVGGAYAHLFLDLLDFLELRSVIITDLDSVNAANNGSACKVSEGTGTSNACLKNWFEKNDISITELLAKTKDEKIDAIQRIAYEIPEAPGGPCGRSFEGAFMLANENLFGIAGNNDARADAAWEKAAKVSKTDFALEYGILKTNWTVPLYIREALEWLADDPVQVAPPPAAPVQAAPPPDGNACLAQEVPE